MSAKASMKWKIDNRTAVKGQVRAALILGLEDAGEFLLQKANESIPHEEGTLEASGKTRTDSAKLRTYVGYDTPYAIRQHEELSWKHDSGRRAKWLELTFREQQNRVSEFLAKSVRKKL